MINRFQIYYQLDSSDCGITCLRMIAKFYGRVLSNEKLRRHSTISREGISLLSLSDVAENFGFHSLSVKTSLDKLIRENATPFIAHWDQRHFVVVYKIKKNKVYIADPSKGKLVLTQEEFLNHWASTVENNSQIGIVLLIKPTPDFYKHKNEITDKSRIRYLFKYLKPYKKLIIQLVLGLIIGSLIQLILPFLTQSIVDFGIANNNLSFIYLVLLAQMVLFVSRMMVDFIRSWILLHISTRVNVSLISDFLIKLMKLSIGYFDSKVTGDILQRINDHRRIEGFLTGHTLNSLFLVFNLVIFGAVLAYYSVKILFVFIFGSILYILWIQLFMKKRRELDNRRFRESSIEQSNIIQLIQGMQEIKLQNAEKQMRWSWEGIQANLFRISVKVLTLNQYQQTGTVFINGSKNILITFIAAYSVIQGDMTLGMMLAIQYIIGQLDAPIEQFVEFIHSFQDAKISLERLGEVHKIPDEQIPDDSNITNLPIDNNIIVKNVFFQYEKPYGEIILNNVSFHIPKNKITAIVGTSGSGKTTLIKLLLGFYNVDKGSILVGTNELNSYSQPWWRDQVGAVMQDGYIFNDTIANNIAVGHYDIDKIKLNHAVKIANIRSFIEELPLKYNTKIGSEGHGLSQGQKQRILLARAIYKNPSYLFLDEATNALDAFNEKIIMNNLSDFFSGRTVVIVAHRLSTVKNADQIIVLEKGSIIETGDHSSLTKMKGAYYTLVKNQLELGN